MLFSTFPCYKQTMMDTLILFMMASDYVFYLCPLENLKHKVAKQYHCCIRLLMGKVEVRKLL